MKKSCVQLEIKHRYVGIGMLLKCLRCGSEKRSQKEGGVMKQLVCDRCGSVDKVHVDGYHFGDRLLEGVMFIVEIKNGEVFVSGVTKDSQSYFDDLNKEKWLVACKRYVETEDDILCNCLKCRKGEVMLTEEVL